MGQLDFRKAFTPYFELIRLDKPAGILYLYFPSMASTSLAACLTRRGVSCLDFLFVNLILLLSSVMLRGAGCSWNDLLDRKIDQQVSRTKTRPLVRGAITPTKATLFTVVQLALFFGTLSCLFFCKSYDPYETMPTGQFALRGRHRDISSHQTRHKPSSGVSHHSFFLGYFHRLSRLGH